MNIDQAKRFIVEVFGSPLGKDRFKKLIREILHTYDEVAIRYKDEIPAQFKPYIEVIDKIGSYKTTDGSLDVLIIKMKKECSIAGARVAQRNAVAWYLNVCLGNAKDAALVAFSNEENDDWRFSYIQVELGFRTNEDGEEVIGSLPSPARRWSFLVGPNEKTHTAQSRFLSLLVNSSSPTLAEIREVFNIEKVTKEFYEKYRELYYRTYESIKRALESDVRIGREFTQKAVIPEDFAKKLLGQIVFLYYLQKKGWFGVARGEQWGNGSKNFLRELYEKKHSEYDNFFNDILEPLFYEALSTERQSGYYCKFNCRIPFLNGGLFDPIGNYDWINTDICLPDTLFVNSNHTPEGDVGDGILDVFDRYNFTVNEEEPLEKEVAVDPEMLGKVFENLLEIKDRKSSGTYYTPRDVVHYMCQESIVKYLMNKLSGQVIESGIRALMGKGINTEDKAPLRKDQLGYIDSALKDMKVCDPAIGSGAFPVGMMMEVVHLRERISNHLGQSTSIYDIKRAFIENCLYGVDINPGAVEIAKLRLWLSLIVEENSFEDVKPLPNLDYKIVEGDSLLGQNFTPAGMKEIETLKNRYFLESRQSEKVKIRKEINSKIVSLLSDLSQLTGMEVIFDFWVNFSEVFRNNGGFDIVIGNPPYVSSKDVDKSHKDAYMDIFGISDDLYNYFFCRAFDILKSGGIIAFITSDTYLTIESKHNLRKLFQSRRVHEIIKTSNVFEIPMVSPAIFIGENTQTIGSNYVLVMKDANADFSKPIEYAVDINVFRNCPNEVFFMPNQRNMEIYNRYSTPINTLLNTYWDLISTSKNIKNNSERLRIYRESLKSGDVTLLGLLTEGGVGLQTGDNGRFVGVVEGSKQAQSTKQTRPIKLFEAMNKKEIDELRFIEDKEDAKLYLSDFSESDTRDLFLSLKKKYGRDIFGSGYLYMVIGEEEIADLNSLTESEKVNGISVDKPYFVPYDKGDREGNRWYLETPYYIDWSENSVTYFKTNSGKKGEGMPVVRNPQFYFKEGFCWTDVNSTYIKARKKTKGVYDVLSMSLFSLMPSIPDEFFVCLINSKLMSEYVQDFVNNTPHFQINDARQLPIVIPAEEQICRLREVFDKGYGIQMQKLANGITNESAEIILNELQNELDELVGDLYGIR